MKGTRLPGLESASSFYPQCTYNLNEALVKICSTGHCTVLRNPASGNTSQLLPQLSFATWIVVHWINSLGQLISADLNQLIEVSKDHKTYWNKCRVPQVQATGASGSQPEEVMANGLTVPQYLSKLQRKKGLKVIFDSDHVILAKSPSFCLERAATSFFNPCHSYGGHTVSRLWRAAASEFAPELEGRGEGLFV